MLTSVRRTLALVLATLALLVGVAVVPAAAATQTLTVNVVDPRTGQLTDGYTCVWAEPLTSGNPIARGCTTSTAPGIVTLSLNDGVDYRLVFRAVPTGFLNGWYYGGTRDPGSATAVRAPGSVSFPLVLAAVASGTLTVPGGGPAVGYSVEVRSTTNGIDVAYATTDGDGHWSTSPVLPAGTYTVKFGDSQWAYGKRSADAATVITLAGGPNVVDDAILPSAGGTPPTIVVPTAPLVVEATGPDGAVVDYAGLVSATTADGASVSPSCSPASGSTLAVADWPVTCTATDPSTGAVATTQFTVRVQDTTAPVLTVSPDITVAAQNSSGAGVGYTQPSAVDLVDGVVGTTCDRPWGSTFPVGTTTVTCSASDSHGNTAQGSFRVTVLPWQADLHVTVTAPATLGKHGSGTWTVTVTNDGTSTAYGTRTVLTLAGVTVQSVTPATKSGRLTVAGTSLTGALWETGTLAAGQSATYTVVGTPTASRAGNLRVLAGATSSVPDPATTNNLATAATTVTK